MGHFRHSIVVGAALLIGQTAAAKAADLEPYTPPPVVEAPIPVHYGGWYFRGYVGVTNQDIDTITNPTIEAGDFTIEQFGFDSSPFIGAGVGFIISDRFRLDFTGEYRGRADFRAIDTYVDPGCGPGVCTNQHTGTKREWLFLANGYWDIGKFRGFTPYLGAGIGFAKVTLENFWDQNLVTNGLHWADENTEWNFAWALHAGLSYEITPTVSVDLSYRYTRTGDGVTDVYYTYDSSVPQPGDPTTLKDIQSHDVMIGLRWKLGSAVYMPPPEPMPPMK